MKCDKLRVGSLRGAQLARVRNALLDYRKPYEALFKPSSFPPWNTRLEFQTCNPANPQKGFVGFFLLEPQAEPFPRGLDVKALSPLPQTVKFVAWRFNTQQEGNGKLLRIFFEISIPA